MKKQIGVWLDKQKAIIISLEEETQKLTKLESGVVSREREPGESKKYGRFGKQFLSLGKTREKRIKKQLDNYLKTLLSEIKHADEIVLFGPAETKNNLSKLIQKNGTLAARLKSVQSADKMTENQMVAWVKNFFKE